jgi:DNA-binding transcriptional MerR regulator
MILLDSFNTDNIIDVNYMDADKEDTKSRVINGEPLFFTTMQAAGMVGVEASTIRFWGKRFEHLLDIEVSNRNRQFKKTDIDKLKFIKKLAREDGLTLQQIEDYVSSKGFDINEIERSVIDASNPLAIQTFITAVTMEMDKKLNIFSENLLNKIQEQHNINFTMQQEVNEKIHETIAITVDEIVSEKLESTLSDFKNYVDAKEEETKARDIEMLNTMQRNMEDRKQHQELVQKIELEHKNKSLWKRILNK